MLVEVDDGVATLTLNRPDAMNAFDHTMDREFHEAMWLLDADDAVRVIVVTGAGRAFCSGIDLSGGADVFGADAHEAHDAAQGVDSDSRPGAVAFWTMRTPVIGAINGAAVGAGLTVPMLFDLRIVAADAKLGFVFTRRGIVPDANIHWLLPRLVGVERPSSCCCRAACSAARRPWRWARPQGGARGRRAGRGPGSARARDRHHVRAASVAGS